MTWEHRDHQPAVRTGVYIVMGLAGGTGTGKSLSAYLMAQGIVGRDDMFAVLDTENRRALHYSPLPGEQPNFKTTFRFYHRELRPPFTPEAYQAAILDLEAAGYRAIVVDSFSHEHEGEGGLLDMQEAELGEMVERALSRNKNAEEWRIRDAMLRTSWIRPKRRHKVMVQRLMQVRAHLILCLRAEDKVDFKKDKDGKTVVVPMETLSGFKGWIPICEKRLPFELTASFILTPDKPGVPGPIKLQEQHKHMFPVGQQITEESGRLLAVWSGAASPTSTTLMFNLPPPQPAARQETQPAQETHISEPDDPSERAKLIADATRLGRSVLHLTVQKWAEVAIKHVGASDLNSAGVTVATLTALVNELRERANEPAWGEVAA